MPSYEMFPSRLKVARRLGSLGELEGKFLNHALQ